MLRRLTNKYNIFYSTESDQQSNNLEDFDKLDTKINIIQYGLIAMAIAIFCLIAYIIWIHTQQCKYQTMKSQDTP